MTALVLALAKLGDFLQATALFSGLRKRAARLQLACAQKAVAEAAELSGLFETVLTLDPTAPGPLKLPEKPQVLYNLSMSSLALEVVRKIQAQAPSLEVFGPRPDRTGLALPPAQATALALIQENRRLAPFNLVDIWRRLEPGWLAPSELAWPTSPNPGALSGPPVVGLALGAGHPRRRWPRQNFERLAQGLWENYQAQIVLLGAPAEKALGKAVSQSLGLGPNLTNLVGATDLKELSQALRGLQLLVAADTGIIHLATALKTPVLGLYFGPALARETGPYGPGQLVIQALASCAPCLESRPCPQRVCQAWPSPQLALAAAGQLLKERDAKKPAAQSPNSLRPAEPAPEAALNQAAPAQDKMSGQPDPTQKNETSADSLAQDDQNEPAGAKSEKIWITAIDSFGYKQEPLIQTEPGEPEELRAEIIREAARAALDPAYQPQIPQGSPLVAGSAYWQGLAGRIWPQPNQSQMKGRFLASLEEAGLLV
ncbi:MAG: glycosyltransferase family 9 protein [Deltaproteobacteria bacterium]|jgi:ADP-heptose:LPS heptosyltransferase|nr:glycosyltransferase family 9 protein [Deltaproteobacteria bacterium]